MTVRVDPAAGGARYHAFQTALVGVVLMGVALCTPVTATAQEPDSVSHTEITAELDSDGDGVSDVYETTYYGTDPAYQDSDLDNLSDGQEIYDYYTNPLLADTDGDGATDDWEIFWGSDPLVGVPVEPNDGGGGGGGGLPEFDPEGGECILDPDSCFQIPRVKEAEETDQ